MIVLTVCMAMPLAVVIVWTPVSVICDTPLKLSSFDDVTKALYQGAPVRYQVNNATTCIPSSHFMAKQNIVNDVSVAMVKSDPGQKAIFTWSKKIIDGMIFNITGPVALTTETTILENGTLSIKMLGLRFKNFGMVFSGKLQCRWDVNTSEAVVFQQDKFGTELKDLPALSQALHTGYSVAYDLDLSKLEPPGKGHLVGKMEHIMFQENRLQFDQILCNGTQRTNFRIQTTPPQTVIVTQLSYNAQDNEVSSQITRKGGSDCIHFLRIPYDS